MPRNSSGVYTLPDPPRVPLTTITSDDENDTRDDMATELTNSLDRNGRGGMIGAFKVADGTAPAPGLAWTLESNTGWYRAGTNDIRMVVGGVEVAKYTPLGPINTLPQLLPNGSESDPSISWASEADSGWYRAASGDFRFTVGGDDVLQITADGMQLLGSAVYLGVLRQDRADGVFNRWVDTGGVSGQKTAGLQIDAGTLDFGMMADDFSAFTQWLAFDKVTGITKSFSPAGFRVSDAAMSATDFFVVDNVGLLVSVKTGGLTVSDANDVTRFNASLGCLNFTGLSGSGFAIHYTPGGGGSVFAETFGWGGVVAGSIGISGAGTVYNTVSDRRMKEDIRSLSAVGDVIDRLSPVRFKWKGLKDDHVGFIAQDVVEAVPEAVQVPGNPSALWQMDAGKFMPYVIAELKALRNRVSQLEG